MMTAFLTELCQAAHQLRRAPRFSALAISILATGLGATVAVFSLFHSLVLRPLPFPAPERLVAIQAINATKALVQDQVSVSDAHDLSTRSGSFSASGAFRPNFAAYTRPGEAPVRLVTALITPGLLDTFDVRPAWGRGFVAEEFSLAAPRTVLLSHGAWQRLFAGAPEVLGRTMQLDDEPHTIIGVMPERFREPAFVEAWLPFPREAGEYYARDSRFWTMIGRLAPGSDVHRAQAELAAIAADLARMLPETNRDWSVGTVPLQEHRTRALRPALLLLLGAVALVLIVACLNLANLLLSRALAQRTEWGVRLALGATPQRLALRVLLESLLLAAVGSAGGALLAAAAVHWGARHLPPALIPRAHELALHAPALLLAIALAGLSALACGFLPARQVGRVDVNQLLQGGTRGSTGGTSRWQATLIAAQVALSVMVLAGALLLMKSLQRLQAMPLGFAPQGILTLQLAPPPQRYETNQDLADYYQNLIDAARQVPGVNGASVNASAPLSGITLTYPTWVEGQGRDSTAAREAVYAPVDEDYFALLGIPLRQGRGFTAHDRAGAAPVAIVNEAYVRKVFPDGQAVGRRLLLLPWMGETYREIVGVVADSRQDDLATPPPAQVYVPQQQMPWFFSTLLVRVDRPGVVAPLRAALRAVDPTLPFEPRALEQEIARTTTHPRLYAALFAGFAVIAAALSAFGIYAGLHCMLRRRVREIGVRVALGATPGSIVRWVLRQTGSRVLAGTALGLAGAVPLALALRSQLFGVAALDAATFLAVPLCASGVAFAAALPLAVRAARVDPVTALQQD